MADHRLCNTCCFYTVTIVERTRLDVTLYVHGLSCSFCEGLASYSSKCGWNSCNAYPFVQNLYVWVRSELVGKVWLQCRRRMQEVRFPRKVLEEVPTKTTLLKYVCTMTNNCTDSIHTGPARRQHQHTDCIYSHHIDWLHENCSNIMILAHFIVNRTILMF
jgi:hypothetical protein